MANDYTITIDGTGNVESINDQSGNQVKGLFKVTGGDTVTWQASKKAGIYPVWYIVFESPFQKHVIKTDPGSGHTGQIKVNGSASVGTCAYLIASTDPSPLRAGLAKPPIQPAGGGIIIDN